MSMEAGKLNLDAYGVEEMSRTEMFYVNGGGGMIGRAIGWIGGQIVNVASWIWDNCEITVSVSIGTNMGANVCVRCPVN